MNEISNDLLVTAQELGAVLRNSPVVQEYIQARDALMQDADLLQLESKIDQVYQDLIARQQNGEMLFPHEVNEFYDLRELYNRHPLVMAYTQQESAIKALFGEVGATISSILSVDYTQLAGK